MEPTLHHFGQNFVDRHLSRDSQEWLSYILVTFRPVWDYSLTTLLWGHT